MEELISIVYCKHIVEYYRIVSSDDADKGISVDEFDDVIGVFEMLGNEIIADPKCTPSDLFDLMNFIESWLNAIIPNNYYSDDQVYVMLIAWQNILDAMCMNSTEMIGESPSVRKESFSDSYNQHYDAIIDRINIMYVKAQDYGRVFDDSLSDSDNESSDCDTN